MPGSFSLDEARNECCVPESDCRFKYAWDMFAWWPLNLLVSVAMPPTEPIPAPKLLGMFGPAGEATDLTRLEPRPMPDACPVGLLVAELKESPTVSYTYMICTYFFMIYGLNIELRLLPSLFVLDFMEQGSTLSTWIWCAL